MKGHPAGGPAGATLHVRGDRYPERREQIRKRGPGGPGGDTPRHRLRTVPRDAALYPELTPQIREAMLGEAHRFVGDVYRGGGALADLLTANDSFTSFGFCINC